jgi:hypothetical protein
MSSLLGRVPARGESVQWREFGSEAILLDPVTGQFAQVNDTGVVIWACIDGRRTVEEIARQVAADFEADQADVVADVQAFIGDLIDKRLLTLAS